MPESINPTIASEKHNAGRKPDTEYVTEVIAHTPEMPQRRKLPAKKSLSPSDNSTDSSLAKGRMPGKIPEKNR